MAPEEPEDRPQDRLEDVQYQDLQSSFIRSYSRRDRATDESDRAPDESLVSRF